MKFNVSFQLVGQYTKWAKKGKMKKPYANNYTRFIMNKLLDDRERKYIKFYLLSSAWPSEIWPPWGFRSHQNWCFPTKAEDSGVAFVFVVRTDDTQWLYLKKQKWRKKHLARKVAQNSSKFCAIKCLFNIIMYLK